MPPLPVLPAANAAALASSLALALRRWKVQLHPWLFKCNLFFRADSHLPDA
jgi:hypothetical protein